MKTVLSTAELENRVRKADTIEQYRRWQVILLRTKKPEMKVKEVAEICQVAYKTVTQWYWLYHTGGAESLLLTGRGGRYHNLMSREAEREMLKNLQEKGFKVKEILNPKENQFHEGIITEQKKRGFREFCGSELN